MPAMVALVTTSEDGARNGSVAGSVAVIVAVPAETLVARPVLVIVATVAGVEAHVTLVVMLFGKCALRRRCRYHKPGIGGQCRWLSW